MSVVGQVRPAEVSATGRSRRATSQVRLYLLLAFMILTWGANFVIGKVALREMPGIVLATLRTTLAGLFITPIFLWHNRGLRRSWPRREVAALLSLGILGAVGNQVLFVIGLSRTSVAHASVAVALSPITVLLIAAMAGQEKLTGRKLVGMLIAILGIVALQVGRTGGRGPTLAGDLIVVLSGSVFAMYAVFGKNLAMKYGTLTANTFAYAGGAIVMLPVTFWAFKAYDLSRISVAAWASVAYMAVFPAVIAYLIFYHALKSLPASRVSAFSYLQPVLATVLAALVLGERPGAAFAIACALVLTGVFLTERG